MLLALIYYGSVKMVQEGTSCKCSGSLYAKQTGYENMANDLNPGLIPHHLSAIQDFLLATSLSFPAKGDLPQFKTWSTTKF